MTFGGLESMVLRGVLFLLGNRKQWAGVSTWCTSVRASRHLYGTWCCRSWRKRSLRVWYSRQFCAKQCCGLFSFLSGVVVGGCTPFQKPFPAAFDSYLVEDLGPVHGQRMPLMPSVFLAQRYIVLCLPWESTCLRLRSNVGISSCSVPLA